MRSMGKKALAYLLVAVMCLSATNVSVFAQENEDTTVDTESVYEGDHYIMLRYWGKILEI